MHTQSRISSKGVVTIPAELRARHGLSVGTVLDIIETPNGVLLKAADVNKAGLAKHESVQQIPKADGCGGPLTSSEDIGETVEQDRAQGGPED